MNPYPWLTIGEDGSLGANLQGCTGAEMDRRLVIMQEIEAGRLVVAGDAPGPNDGRVLMVFRDALGEVRRITGRELHAAGLRFDGDMPQRERRGAAIAWLRGGGRA